MSHGAKGKEYGPKVKLLENCLLKYQSDKDELLARISAFKTYTDATCAQIVSAKSMDMICKVFLSPWTVHLLYIRDFHIKVYLGTCLRESFEELDKEFVGKLKDKDTIKAKDEDYCQGMELYPFSICSNFGITRFLETINSVSIISEIFPTYNFYDCFYYRVHMDLTL